MPQRDESNKLSALQSRLGSSIRNRRQSLGFTQEELAWRASLHRTYIADVERGVRNVTLRTVGQLAGALKASVAELLTEPSAANPSVTAIDLGEILLVEDNSADVEMTMRALGQSRLRNPVRVITNGEAALKHLLGPGGGSGADAPTTPQLILLDLHLPKVSGLEVLRRLKADERTRGIPVIVLTVSRRDRDMQECRALGVEHYLVKPVTSDSFSRLSHSLSVAWALIPSAVSVSPVVGL